MFRRILTALSATALIATLAASAVAAGEVTGSGVQEDQNKGRSWCSFSGLNDKVAGEGSLTDRVQSFGRDVSTSVHEGDGPLGGVPGTMCNPNKTFLPPNPNRG